MNATYPTFLKVNEVYKFDYNNQPRIGKVVKIGPQRNDLSYDTRLVMFRTPDGVRQMYNSNMLNVVKVGILGKIILWLKGIRL